MSMRVFMELRGRMNELNKNLPKENVSINKDIETIRKNQS